MGHSRRHRSSCKKHSRHRYHHPKKGHASRTRHGRKDYTTKKGHKKFNRRRHRQSHAQGSHTKRRPYTGGRKKRRRHRTHKRRKRVPWAGWGRLAPHGKQRTRMYRKCGKRCFLGKKTPGDRQHPNFPICAKGTCKVNTKGLYAAYVRAKQWGKKRSSYKTSKPRMRRAYYTRVASKAKHMLKRRGIHVGK